MAKSTGKPAKSAPTKPRASQKTEQKPPEDRGIRREVIGVLLFFAGALLLYLLITDPKEGFAREIVTVARGLAGGMTWVLPLLLGWSGILSAFSGREHATKPSRVLLVFLLGLLILTMVHVFSADAIMEGAPLYNYERFITRSYAYQIGGAGAIGALLCWPLYRNLGVAGALMILFALILVDLILQRKISLSRIGHTAQQRYDAFREQQQERAMTRMERRAAEAAIPKVAPRPSEMDDPFAKYVGDHFKSRDRAAGMRIEQIANAPLPGEPSVDPAPPDDSADDIPDFLSGRRKPRVKAEPIRVAEPKPLPRYEPPQPDGSEVAERPRTVSGRAALADQTWTDVPLFESAADDDALDRFMQDEPQPVIEDVPAPVARRPEPAPVPDDAEPPIDAAEALPDLDDADDEPPFDLAIAPQKAVAAPEMPTRKPLYPIAKPVPKEPQAAETKPEAAEEAPYVFPPIELLQPVKPQAARGNQERDRAKGELLIETLLSFGIETTLVGIAHGPTITRFELTPAPGVKVSRITSLTDDIALNLAAQSVRIEAPIPGKSAVGVEVPNDQVETVPLRDVLESADCKNNPSRLAVALGRDNAGRYIVADLARMPHTLIAGQTGSGKSVCVNCIICSILYRATPQEVRLILIDPKVVELSCYNGVPHLLVPVVTDPGRAAGALDWAVAEMTTRYKKFAELGVRNMKGYNQHRPEDVPAMPQIVIIIDELADLMMVAPGDVEDAICRLAQLARAAGIHLVIATQRPSVDIITGKIKANIPSRIAFQTASQIDSRTILDVGGAEKLLGQGDMLYAPSGAAKRRAQGAWVSDDEVANVVDFLKAHTDATYDDDVMEHLDSAELSDAEHADALAAFDELLPAAVELVVDSEQASVSLLQRRLRVGHSRAGRLIDEMAVRGIVGPDEGSKARKVLITREQYRAKFKGDE